MKTHTVGSMYYINQGKEPFASIKMKSGETIKSMDCAVCAYAMIICHKENYTTEKEALQVVKDIITQCTTNSGLIYTTFSNKKINGKTYSAIPVSDIAAQIHKNTPVVARLEKNGSACHFTTVIGTDPYKTGMNVYQIKDPGKQKNSTLQDAIDNYPGCSLKGKFIFLILFINIRFPH